MRVKHFGRGSSSAMAVICALVAGALLCPRASGAASDPVQPPGLASSACPSPFSAEAFLRLSRVGRKLSRLAPIRVLAIGSSSTQGIGASSPARSYPARLEADLRLRWPKVEISVMNAGIGGETVAATVTRLERLVGTEAFDLVIWQLGTNDAVHGDDIGAFREATLRGIEATRAAGVDLVLLDPQYYPGIRDPQKYERFVSVVKEIGQGQHVPVFERYTMMKDWGARGDAILLTALSSDHFHMNDKGYGCLAEALTAEIGLMTEAPALAKAPELTLSATK
jgi:lysophospholipase L1-like esterase